MTSSDITRDIIVAMIERGMFDYDNPGTFYDKTTHTQTNAICEAFTQIMATVHAEVNTPRQINPQPDSVVY